MHYQHNQRNNGELQKSCLLTWPELYDGLQKQRGWDAYAYIHLYGLLVLHYARTANGIDF